ncbi:MAG: sulfite exporter TauE/SafE family protein [Bacteroidota bacterium]
MEVIGYIACALIGISLGVIGAGGSILTVPVLVFVFHVPPVMATSYSLFVVGVTSLFSAAGKFRKGDVLLGPAITFGLTSMAIVLLIRHYIIPHMPKYLGTLGNASFSYDLLCMLLFSGLMIVAAFFMINKNGRDCDTHGGGSRDLLKVIPYALMVGVVTGFLGAGGGFLIIPVMTLLLGIDMKKAVGTSLAVVALNSLSGFANDVNHITIDWEFLLIITLIALIGSISGAFIAGRINAKKLKGYFGWFVLGLGVIIFTAECYTFLKFV